jgi:hypothetical protein
MRLPPKKKPGNPVLASDWNTILDAIAARTPRPSSGLELAFTSSGFAYRARQTAGGATPVSDPCPFGEITSWSEPGEGEEDPPVGKQGIRGGICYCGDKNFNVPPKAVNPDVDGEWLYYLFIDCESNRDDAHEIILPGIKTSSASAPDAFWRKDAATAETQYPDNQNPEVSDGLGTIVIPIGRVTVSGGTITIAKVDCGNVTINQCGGVLSHTRG